MKCLALALTLVVATIVTSSAEEKVPDLRGTWSGKGKAIVFGNNANPRGTQPADPPHVQEIEAIYIVEGQEGRLAWGRSSSSAADTNAPFAWAMAGDNKSIIGADMDGYFRMTLLTSDRMERCYVHNGISPTHSIVATCFLVNRAKQQVSR